PVRAGGHTYEFRKLRKGGHPYFWTKFSEFYPEMCSSELGIHLINERNRWNYDLNLPSRVLGNLGKEEAKKRWEINFLDPDYGKYPDPGAAEYYHDLMGGYGYKEDSATTQKNIRSVKGDGIPIHVLYSRSEIREARWIVNWIEEQVSTGAMELRD
ncbi:unnamed protein product, partial [marine sediment metagenome]